MKKFRIVVLILLAAIATPLVLHRRAWAVHHSAANAARAASDSAVRITFPKSGETLGDSSVIVQYERPSSNTARNAAYELRLDRRDSVKTAATTYTFNGLNSGNHQLIVRQVDSKSDPILGTESAVNFSVHAQETAANTASPGASSGLPPLPQPLTNDLPNGNGSLPLLSIIGFGILVGGVISALRTRPAHK